MKALRDNIIYRVVTEEKKTATGIIIPQAGNKKYEKGVVVSVGSQVSEIEPDVKEGSEILVFKHQTTDIEVDGEKLKIVKIDGSLLIL